MMKRPAISLPVWIILVISVIVIFGLVFGSSRLAFDIPSAQAAPFQPEVLTPGQQAAIEGTKLLMDAGYVEIYLPLVRR